MTCQVVISDFVIERRMSFVLDSADFATQQKRWAQQDNVLDIFKDHAFFTGCDTWGKLDIKHFHALITNMIRICAEETDEAITNKAHPPVGRLIFLLCSMVTLLESRTGSNIDVLRVNRVRPDDVLYDYSARLDVIIAPPKTSLRVVIDND